MHHPVLLKEVIDILNPKPGDFIIDGTIDGGGHAEEILKRIAPDGLLLGIDLDKGLIAKCRRRLASPLLILEKANYKDLPEILKKRKWKLADGLLLDLGFSSEQLEDSGRGFSFAKDEPLIMTYDDGRKPVEEILEELSEKESAKIIFEYSGEKFAMRIARAIKEAQRKAQQHSSLIRANKRIVSIKTTGELARIICEAVPKNYERGRIHPATRTFQALRIYANNELENLKIILGRLGEILKPGGRVAIITFHSLEDRIVKIGFREMRKNGLLKIITKKPIVAGREEISENQRSRPAKLRAAQMIQQ